MYAQLCRKLCEESPNFDPPTTGTGQAGNSTFRRLLLAKCKDEFENRSKASEDFEKRDGALSNEEEEQRCLAKHKMLGNIKFIGELGKQGLLQEAILHQCIQQLLAKKKRHGIKDTSEDLECLGQIMKTVGRRLDTDKARSLMDQYFERMKSFANNLELPSRIRFMLQDVMELRLNKWIPRRATSEHGPRTIQQIREEADRDYGMFIPPSASPHHQGGMMTSHGGHHLPYGGLMVGRNLPPSTAAALAVLNSSTKSRGGLDDVFGPLPLGVGSLGTGPGVISGDGFPTYSSNMGRPNRNNLNNANISSPLYYGGQGRSNSHHHHPSTGAGNQRERDIFAPTSFPSSQNNSQSTNQASNQSNARSGNPNSSSSMNSGTPSSVGGPHNFTSASCRDMPPRFMKRQTHGGPNSGAEEISLRPAQNSMALKPKSSGLAPNPTSLDKGPYKGLGTSSPSALNAGPNQGHNKALTRDISTSAILSGHNNNSVNNMVSQPLQKEAILIKQVAQEKNKAIKAGPSREEVLKKMEEILKESLQLEKGEENEDDGEIFRKLFEGVSVPRKFIKEVLVMLMTKTLDKNEADREVVSRMVRFMKKEDLLALNTLLEALKTLFDKMTDLEGELPRIKSLAASFAARAVADDLISLGELGELLEGGLHYPLFMLCLQQLHKSQGRSWLTQAFNHNKINLLFMLPEIDRTKERLADILEDRGLNFLYPLLRIQADLWKQVQADSSPNGLYRWVKDNVDPGQQLAPGFIYALVTSMIKFVTLETTLADNVDPNMIPEKVLVDKEKDLLEKFKPVFQAFLNEHGDLQLVALYALQVHCHNSGFPKGMLLRWFNAMYDLEIVEEEAFLKWKEDVNDEYPGKGNALFQVNQWLTWLEEAEEEEGSDDGEN